MYGFETVLHPIHRAGHPFIIVFCLITLLCFMLWAPLGWLAAMATCWCVYFFRDPERVPPEQEGLVVATGDGVISDIAEALPPPELNLGDTPRTRISIFLNVFNVHVNRIPIAGEITALYYHPGKFLNASLDKASEDNERHSACVTTKDGKEVVFVQIAGLVARRILNDLEEGQQVATGERYGIIRFGSRCDIYLPEGVEPLVKQGQLAVGGETILADLTQ